ncbi:MAG: sigma-70 family RNA polymerase sigma factor [Luteitalea sp.]|nr:sigma-70 family RNA polymerase sigma factor [Luteitalea sp.]
MERRMAEGLSVKPVGLEWASSGEVEAELVARCRAGDEQACTALVEAHQRMVYQLALHLLGEHDEALDLSQEVFLRVFRTLPSFRGHASLRTWIYRIVINQARNRQRWWRRRKQREQVSLDDNLHRLREVPDPDRGDDPEATVERKEVVEFVWRALDRLPFDQRTAIVLREIDGLSYDEIAYSLGVAVGTVKSRLARARHQLREELRVA